MTKGEWGSVRAYFDLKTSEGLVIKGFRILDGSNGLFVGFPSVKNKDGEYNDTVWCEKQKRQEVNEMATNYYNASSTGTSSTPAPAFDDDSIPF